jgi:hypothetical protein
MPMIELNSVKDNHGNHFNQNFKSTFKDFNTRGTQTLHHQRLTLFFRKLDDNNEFQSFYV